MGQSGRAGGQVVLHAKHCEADWEQMSMGRTEAGSCVGQPPTVCQSAHRFHEK